jgi:acyl-CoA thioester hydrolase
MGLEIRIIYGDTDQMGVVYYANYLRYFEASRSHFLRERGRSYRDLERHGVLLPVVEAHVRYLASARYEDLIHVEPTITAVRGATLRFDYRVTRGGDLLAEGYTVHACIAQATGRPTRFPADIRALLQEPAGI